MHLIRYRIDDKTLRVMNYSEN